MASVISWYKTPIPKERLRELTARSDARALIHAGAFLLLFLLSITLNLFLYFRGLWGVMIVTCFLHCILVGYMGMGASVHELSHGTAFRTKWLNEAFLRIFSFITWNNQLHFRTSHSAHHLYTYFREKDREQIADPIQFTVIDVISWLTFDFRKFYQFMRANMSYALGRTDIDFFFWCPLLPPDHKKSRAMMRWARFLILGHLALIVVFIFSRLWILLLLVNFAYFFVTFFDHSTGILQHMGLRGDVPDWRMNSYTVNLGPVMRFLYWNMNYHTEHHMYAGVPFYNLPALRNELEWDLQKPLDGFWRSLGHILRVRKLQRSNPNYRHAPEFPDTATPPASPPNTDREVPGT